MSKNLFNSDESDNEVELKTNDSYAKTYNKFRQNELLKKLKDRRQDESDSNESSSGTDSSEENELNDPKFDQEFFKTLASIKSKDPSIYDKNTQFFDEFQSDEDEHISKKEAKTVSFCKPMTVNDYERKILLENEGKFEDDSDDENHENTRTISPTFAEEEQQLKQEFKKVIDENDGEEDKEDFGGIFKKRLKTQQEKEIEEDNFTQWLAGKKEDIEENMKTALKPLKEYWSSNKLPTSETFLRDYILNKGYSETNLENIPTYDEIVGDDQLSEDERELDRQAEFEENYNHRFEEPDDEFLKRYPRTVLNSVRQKDDKRKKKRNEIKERKQQEKEQKMKEFEIVKEMKRKEIEEKIRKLKEVTGNEEIGFKESELEEDFDPEEHDRRMKELFNEEYYQVDEGEEKPGYPSDLEDLKTEDWDNYNPGQDNSDTEVNQPHCEDEDFNMDCDYDPKAAKEALQRELIENTKKRKGRKNRRNQFKEMIKSEKPVFNPDDEKTYAEYIDEYYKLDCEDVIDDIPCRFKYVETIPNDFGLTIEEILLAKNKELNQWASLKKAVQLRPDFLEKKDQKLYKLKARNEKLKRKIFKSLYGECSDGEDDDQERTFVNEAVSTNGPKQQLKRKSETTYEEVENKQESKKIKQCSTGDFPPSTEDKDQDKSQECKVSITKKKKNKNKKKKINAIATKVVTSPEQKAKNISERKKKNKKKKMKAKTPSTPGGQKNENNSENKKNEQMKMNGDTQSSLAEQKTESEKCTIQPKNPFSKKMAKSQGTTNSKKLQNKNKFLKKKNSLKETSEKSVSDERLKAFGINPKKFHKKQKYGKKVE